MNRVTYSKSCNAGFDVTLSGQYLRNQRSRADNGEQKGPNNATFQPTPRSLHDEYVTKFSDGFGLKGVESEFI